jgi:hypothetical protein
MILLATLFVLQSKPSVVAEDEIVVTARRIERLRRLSVSIKHDKKTDAYRCIIKRRSGDPSLDGIVCDAALTCAPKVQSREDARACMAPTMDALVARGAQWRSGTDIKSR